MAYVTKENAAKYTTYEQYELLLAGIHDLEVQLDIKMTGGEDNEANSSPIWGDVAIISANYDESFFIRWVCKDPKGRDLNFLLQLNDGEYFEVVAWYNGINYTCFVPSGHARVGMNSCRLLASNGLYSKESAVFSVDIPKQYVPQAPNISQDIQNITGKVGTAVKITYTATDNGTIMKHFFNDGLKEQDITAKVVRQGSTYSYTTNWDTMIVISEASFRVADNEGLSATSNKFKITIT